MEAKLRKNTKWSKEQSENDKPINILKWFDDNEKSDLKTKYCEIYDESMPVVISRYEWEDIDLSTNTDNDGVVFRKNPKFWIAGITVISFENEKENPITIKDVYEKYVQLMENPVPISVLQDKEKLILEDFNPNLNVLNFCLKNEVPILYKHIIGRVYLDGISNEVEDENNVYLLAEDFDFEDE